MSERSGPELVHRANSGNRGAAGYAVAVVATTIAVAVRWFVLPLVGDTSALVPFIPAVMVSGWYGGIRPALLATVLGAMAGNYLWQEPKFTFAVANQREAYSLLFFLGVSVFISSLTEGLHLARREAETAAGALLNSREQLRQLSSRIEAIREQERTRIAGELHDELGQALTALKIELSALESPAVRGAARAAKVREIGELLDSTIKTVRRVVTELRPRMLDVLGLGPAIEWQVKEFQAHTGIRCDVLLPVEDQQLPSDVSTALFRILQEALTNVARHAEATAVTVRLEVENELATLVISDNGRGISKREAASHGSLGLFGMQERARSVGGETEISGLTGRGTRVRVRIPVPESDSSSRQQACSIS